MQQLKSGSLLQGGKYRIEKVLGQGGFGITYLATQELLDRKVCIKEFFFKEYCEREETTNNVSLGTQLKYYDRVLFDKLDDAGNVIGQGPRVQFKTILGLGIGYSF